MLLHFTLFTIFSRWSTSNSNVGRARAVNVMRNRSGPSAALLRHCASAEDFFMEFLTVDMINDIVRFTNQEGERREGPNWKPTSNEEIRILIGLFLLAGVYTSKNEAVRQLWNKEDGRPIFNKAMSRDRFVVLCAYLRFDDSTTRTSRRRTDKLAAFRSFWGAFVTRCNSNYTPNENVTVDEQFVTYRGRCPFRMFIPSKPGRYGVKIWMLCDSSNYYCCNAQIYTGKRDTGREINQGTRVVLELTDHLTDSGRNIVGDNFFSSLHLVQCLNARRLSYLGTIGKNKPELPLEFQPSRQRAIHSSLFGFSVDATIVSYVPKKNKSVNLISSLHRTAELSEDRSKPQIIMDYNKLKCGVDTLDQVIRKYSSKRKTKRWPMALFYNTLDIAAYNAYVCFMHCHPQWQLSKPHRRRLFLITLAKQLINFVELPTAEPAPPLFPPSGKRRRCNSCGWKEDKKTSLQCVSCGKPTCLSHASVLCSSCSV